jgi:CheY-like chemotaxis protein
MTDSVQYTVLLVETNPIDVFLVERAISNSKLPISLRRVTNGEEAIKYLQGEGKYVDRERYPFPSILLTKTRMPIVDGLELLNWVRKQPNLQNLLVVLMNSAKEPGVYERASALGVNAYYVKSADMNVAEESLENILVLLLSSNSE